MAGRESARHSGRRRRYMSPVRSQAAEAIGVVNAGMFVAALPSRGRDEARLGRIQCSFSATTFLLFYSLSRYR